MVDHGPLLETSFSTHGETYRIAVLRGDDVDVISPLLLKVFGPRGFTPEWVRRKYAWERDGARSFACVAFDGDERPVANVGVLPWPIRHGRRVELAAQLADCATSADHRGRGLHARLVALVHEVADSAGMTFVFRFSNDLAFSITTTKLGYTPLDDLVEFHPRIRTVWAERVARRVRLADAFDRHVDRRVRESIDAGPPLESSVLREGFACTDRDRALLDYKERFEGSRVLQLDGARVWLRVCHGLLIGDMAAESDAEFNRGADALERLAARLGVHRVVFQASPGIELSRRLGARYPLASTRHVSLFDLCSRIPLDALRFTFGDIDTF